MGTASETPFTLNLVAFHYKKEIDPGGTLQFGGKPYSVAMNEFLKEHRAFGEEQPYLNQSLVTR